MTNKLPLYLLDSAANVNSQFGEDGIIRSILSLLSMRNSWCVEFGAWDGKYLSNTRRLIDEEAYHAVMIEANRKSFGILQSAFRGHQNVICIQSLVGFSGDDRLDKILERTECPTDFDVLSIDIDGNDFHVWRATEKYRPKIVCIEFNPTIPTLVEFVQPADSRIKWGCSLLSLFKLGQEKGYRLVCANEINAFFVAGEAWRGAFPETDLDVLRYRKIEPNPIFLFSGYDGTVLLSSECHLGWHNLPIRSEDLQLLPKIMRRYPDDYCWIQRKALALLRRMKSKQHVV